MYHTFEYCRLSQAELQACRTLGLGPGDMAYFRSTPELSDAELLNAIDEQQSRGITRPAAVRAVALSSGLHPKTISRRLRALVPQTARPGEAA